MNRKGHINFRALARKLSLVENQTEKSGEILDRLSFSYDNHIIGITGPPGAGKSSLVNQLIDQALQQQNAVAVIAVDPSSPFNQGSVLGDRIRMSKHYNNDKVYIRSVASRGALGGLAPQIVEMVDVVRNEAFDIVIIETVGVGQSEIEIAGLADTTVVTLVPESGDTIQTMKSGILEIADIFVVNKADREDAHQLISSLKKMIHEMPPTDWAIPVIATIATQNEGIDELFDNLQVHKKQGITSEKRMFLLARKVYHLIARHRMKNIDHNELLEAIKAEQQDNFNIYTFAKRYYQR